MNQDERDALRARMSAREFALRPDGETEDCYVIRKSTLTSLLDAVDEQQCSEAPYCLGLSSQVRRILKAVEKAEDEWPQHLAIRAQINTDLIREIVGVPRHGRV